MSKFKTGALIVSAIVGVGLVYHGIKVFAAENSPYGKYSHVKVIVPGLILIAIPCVVFIRTWK